MKNSLATNLEGLNKSTTLKKLFKLFSILCVSLFIMVLSGCEKNTSSDLGTDKYTSNDYGIWYSPVLIMRYSASEQIKLAIRGEYYNDRNRIIIATNSQYGLRVSGISGNID